MPGTHFEESLRSTDPTNSDTDADGLNDYAEKWEYFSDPLLADTDGEDPTRWTTSLIGTTTAWTTR